MSGRAVVSDDEEEMEMEEEDDSRPVSKAAAAADGDDDEEDEEEEGQDEYEKDGFIVDDEEEEEEEEEKDESDEERHKKKKKKRRESESFILDEDDYELLQDNTGFRRPKPNNKFKRLKKAGRDAEGEPSGFSDEEEFDRSSKGGRTAEEKLKHSLFGDDESAPLEDIAEEDHQEEEEEEEEGDVLEDEMADFIVEADEDDVDEEGRPLRRKLVNKKKPRQAAGISSDALQEAQDIFGNVEELLAKRNKSRVREEGREHNIRDEFEPSIISEKYLTEKDEIIREKDVPERMQMLEEITGLPPTDDKSIAEEATWIHNLLTSDVNCPLYRDNKFVKEVRENDIREVLTMMHVQKFDIPFIAMYRKELCASLLKDSDIETQEDEEKTPKIKWHKILWAVQNLDRKWLLLQKRKGALQSYYNKRFEEEARRIDDEMRLALNRRLFSSIIDYLTKAKSEREVDDVDAKFNLHFPPGEVEADEGQLKRPKRRSLYSICYKAGLWEVANKFSVNSERFGLLLELDALKQDDDVLDAKETPEEVAANFTCQMFEKPEDVLKGARHMAAVEISCEPTVRKHVRTVFMEDAVVSTSPTPEGNSIIDAYHHLSGMKWLCDKPISKFEGTQWLLIQKAEEEKLLHVKVKLPEDKEKKLLSNAETFYLSENVSKTSRLWNEQRKMILEESFFTYILPSMEREARSLLTARSKDWLRMEYGKKLWDKVSVAPYQRKEKDIENDNEDEPGLKVLACCWGSGKPPTTFVMLDSAGEHVDQLFAGSISARSQAVAEQQRKKNDQQRVLKFMTDHQPQVVCLGAANLFCRQLKDDIYEVIFKIVEDHPREVSQDMNITIVDESLPHLYENSRVSSDQLPARSGIERRAIALGRYLQNPLAMVATLCGPGKEILSWKLCPQEHFLSPDEKYEVVEQIMVDATNQVGIDVNLAATHEWLFAPLQFISGLGPRKASALQKAFVRAGSIFNRKELTMGRIIRKKVFMNAAGFLRIRRSGAANGSSHIMDLLDDTRIHPESYGLAKTLAKDVYAEDEPQEPNEMDDDEQEMAIEHVRARPDMLKALDIDEYAKSYSERFETNKRETLYDIKMEILHGFQDWRFPFRDLNPEEEFSLLSGETDETISEGRIVQVTARNIQENRISCTFDSGLKALVMADDFSDDGYDPDNIQLRVGDILTGKIKNVNKSRFVVYLTCKASELGRVSHDNRNYDYYYREPKNKGKENARKEKELAKKLFKPRMIVHPRFQNLTADEAMEYLSNKDAGESIIRPSSKGPSYLTLTLKIYDGVYAHKDIKESGKDHKDITSLLRLGKTLEIDKETFEDLDEVMDRYVDPLVAHLKTMLGYRKFKKGTKADVDEQLRIEKAENPLRIVYCFGISHEHPGTFILSYIRSSNPHHEYIGLYPKGFRFRKKDFGEIDRLVAYFQRNIDRPHESLIAARVPMKSPARGLGDGDSGGDFTGGNDYTNLNREWSSTPGSRTGGRFDYRNNTSDRDGHPSGIPRPGRGRGRGRGRGNNGGRDSELDSSPRWSSGSKGDDDGFSSFPGAKVQNSPGKDWFGSGGSGRASGQGSNRDASNAGGSWGSNRGTGRNGGRGGGGAAWGSNDNGDNVNSSWSTGGAGRNESGGWDTAGGSGRSGKDGGWAGSISGAGGWGRGESGDGSSWNGTSSWGGGSGSGGASGGSSGGWNAGNTAGTGWSADPAGKGSSGDTAGFGGGNSEWAGGLKKSIPPQAEAAKGWAGSGAGSGW